MNRHVSFVHLTDIHIGAPGTADEHLHSDTAATLRTILGQVKAMRPAPDFVVMSGDLTNRGEPEAFRELRRLVDEAGLASPIVLALGNHDSRPGFYEGYLGRTGGDLGAAYDHDQVIAGIHVITLDTSRPQRTGGHLDDGQLGWLRDRLDANPDNPKLIVMHHAPALDEDDVAMEWESLSCADTVRFREVVAGRTDVIGILSGHMHYDRVSNWHGIPIVIGIGQHAATDVLLLQHGQFSMVEGASLAIGTIRPSGLTVTFAPLPSSRKELFRFSLEEITRVSQRFYEEEAARVAAE